MSIFEKINLNYMKKNLLFIFLAGISLFLTSNSNGVTVGQGLDRTGSPVGTDQCGACHAGGSFSPSLTIQLKDLSDNLVTSYLPDSTYKLDIVFGGSTAPRYGYQAVALLNSNNNNAGTLTTLNTNSKINTLSSRTYAEHNGNVSAQTYELQWVAPSEGTGAVSFYSAGIAANNNTGTSGDSPVTATALSITEEGNEEVPNSILYLSNAPVFKFFPNPSNDFIYFESLTSSSIQVSVYNSVGRLVAQNEVNNSNKKLDISTLNNGVYFLVLSENNINISRQKLIKN
jgi:hypothetical protein